MRTWLLIASSCLLVSCNCGGARLLALHGGNLRVTLTGVDPKAVTFQVVVNGDNRAHRDVKQHIDSLPLPTELDELEAGTWKGAVAAIDANGTVLQSRELGDLQIVAKETLELEVNLDEEVCDGADNDGNGQVDDGLTIPLCAACQGSIQYIDDDARCGPIDCSAGDRDELRGDNTATGSSKQCVQVRYAPITDHRCVAIGECIPANGTRCTAPVETVLVQGGVCQLITACESGRPQLTNAPDGTPCAADSGCQHGICVAHTHVDSVGCSDGSREGFLSQADHPDIAGCSGAWTVPGITRPGLVPTCNRVSGNHSSNVEGAGCSVVDLCSEGWHVCRGSTEVSQKSPRGCADAVPIGAANKSLFFAVSQASQNGTMCDVSGDNDVFGCGNLGNGLSAGKGCGPLDRALASTQAGTCGFNEAEPGLGPWQCQGGVDSHLHEGALVTKKGCPASSCSSDGNPVGNSDKGGVLCCKD